jgi:hypothetical protein
MELQAGDRVTVVLRPKFFLVTETYYDLDYDDTYNEDDYVEYGELSPPVQEEVLQYFQSPEFLRDQAEGYALNNIDEQKCYLTNPSYDTKIDEVSYELEDQTLLVNLYGHLEEVPSEIRAKDTIRLGSIIPTHVPYECYAPVTMKTFEFAAKEGFGKASGDGPLTTKYGQYLGEAVGRYLINLDFHRTTTYRN